jgi:signal transduction histidine kinase
MTFLKASPERNWLIGGFTLVTLMMGLSSVISYQNSDQLIESGKKSQQTYEVIKNLQDVYALMTIAESGRRGYIDLDDWNELQRYQEAVIKMPEELKQLQDSLADNPVQLQRFQTLRSLINRRMDLLAESIKLYRKETPTPITQSIITNRSIAIRNEIEQVIHLLQQQEEVQLQQSIALSQTNIRDRKVIEIWLMLSSFTVVIVGAIAIYSELLKRQEAESLQRKLAQQKEMSELKLRFFSMVSHEFRTPLSTILGSAQLLSEANASWGEERKQKTIRRIQFAAKSMTQLLTDILMLTRAEVGKLECRAEPLDLESFCLNLIEDFESSHATMHVLEFTNECKYPRANLDERLLYSTLSNLLSNAIKYSPAGSSVHLILKCTPKQIIFQVEDQGIGISVTDQRNLYEPFYRGRNAVHIAGTGLGLAVVKKCIELQQGEIIVDSREGKGTTVTIRLPRVGELPRAAHPVAADLKPAAIAALRHSQDPLAR